MKTRGGGPGLSVRGLPARARARARALSAGWPWRCLLHCFSRLFGEHLSGGADTLSALEGRAWAGQESVGVFGEEGDPLWLEHRKGRGVWGAGIFFLIDEKYFYIFQHKNEVFSSDFMMTERAGASPDAGWKYWRTCQGISLGVRCMSGVARPSLSHSGTLSSSPKSPALSF